MSLTEIVRYAHWKRKVEGNHFELILKYLWKPTQQTITAGQINKNLTRNFLESNSDMKLSPRIFFESYDDKDVRNPDKMLILSQNPSIRMVTVLSNLDMPWEWLYLSENPGISIDDILSHRKLPWFWSCVSAREDLRFYHVEQNPDILWDYEELSHLNGLTIEYVKSKIDKEWFWPDIAKNPTLNVGPLDLVKEGLVEYGDISGNPKLTIDDVKSNPMAPWNYCMLAYNAGIKIEPGYTLPFCESCASLNPNMTLDMVRRHLDSNLGFSSWSGISSQNFVTIDFVVEFPDKDWDWYRLSRNHRIDVSDILKHKELPWRWDGVSRNPSLKIWHVTENPEIPWALSGIIHNSFYMDIKYFAVAQDKDIQLRRGQLHDVLFESTIDPDVIHLLISYIDYE